MLGSPALSVTEYFPGSQLTHAVASVYAQRPTAQSRQRVALSSWAKVPARQLVQTLAPHKENRPARHGWHSNAPVSGACVPAMHGMHRSTPSSLEALPVEHAEQTLARPSENSPRAHKMQEEALSGDHSPGAQSSHALPPLAVENVPAGHAWHVLAMSSE